MPMDVYFKSVTLVHTYMAVIKFVDNRYENILQVLHNALYIVSVGGGQMIRRH